MVARVGQNPDLQNLQQTAFDSSDGSVGQLRGEAVIKERSIQSLVHDSLEELTFQASEMSAAEQDESVDVEDVEVEDLSLTLAEKIKKHGKLGNQLQGERGSLNAAQLSKLLAALRARLPTDPDLILRDAGDHFADVTEQYAALEAVLEELGRRHGDRELRKAAKKASDTLWARHASEIIAGLQARPVAERFAHGDVEQFQALRDAYRAQVQEQPSMLESLQRLRKRFGDDHLERQIAFLIAAGGRDLDALVSSVDKEQLRQVIDNLSRLQVISSMRAQAGTILARMKSRFGVTGGKRDWDLLEDTMVLIQDKWVAGPKIEALSGALSLRDLEGEIYFLRELNAFFRTIPVKTYDDPERRERLLQASQDALDHLVQREEDAL
jgi:type III secretion protein W